MGGKKRNCEKGKPCGATCIERRDICRKELQDNVSEGMSKVSKEVSKGGAELDSFKTAADFDKKLKSTYGFYNPEIKEMHDGAGKVLGDGVLSKAYLDPPSYKNPQEEESFRKLRDSLNKGMGEEEVRQAFYTLRNYTGGKYADYRAAQLGRGGSSDDLERAKLLDGLIQRKEFDRPEVEKFRGKRVDNLTLAAMIESARDNGTFPGKALASWSTELGTAKEFADKNSNRNNRVIQRAVNKKGVAIGSISSVPHELEILTPSTANYRYLGYQAIKVGSITYHVFDVEEL